MILAFSSFASFGQASLRAHIGLYFDSLEPAEQLLDGKWTKKEANVISYFLMASECFPDNLYTGEKYNWGCP